MDALKNIIENKRPDQDIVREEPMVVNVCGRPIYCRAFTYRNHQRWLRIMGTMLVSFHDLFKTLDFPEKLKDLQKFRRQFLALFAQAVLYRRIMRMIRKTVFREPGNRWWRWHWRKFRRHATVQQVMDLFFFLYLFNYEAVKKNAAFLLERMGVVKSQDTYMSSSAKSLGGVVSKSIKPRFPRSPFISNDGPSLLSPKKGQKKSPVLVRKGNDGAG